MAPVFLEFPMLFPQILHKRESLRARHSEVVIDIKIVRLFERTRPINPYPFHGGTFLFMATDNVLLADFFREVDIPQNQP